LESSPAQLLENAAWNFEVRTSKFKVQAAASNRLYRGLP